MSMPCQPIVLLAAVHTRWCSASLESTVEGCGEMCDLTYRFRGPAQSASLSLTTTPAEEMALGLRLWLAPLRPLRGLVPVDEIALTLLLSLRFMAQVTEEMRNLSLGLATHAVRWKQLPSGGGLQVPLTRRP